MLLKNLLEQIKAKILLIFAGLDKLKADNLALTQKVTELTQAIADKDAQIASLSGQLVELQQKFNDAVQQDKIDDEKLVEGYETKLKELQDQLTVANDEAAKSATAAQEAAAQLQEAQQEQMDSESAAQDLVSFLDQHLSDDAPTEGEPAPVEPIAPAEAV